VQLGAAQIVIQASTKTQHLCTVTVIAKINQHAEKDTTLQTAVSKRKETARRASQASINPPKTDISTQAATTKQVAIQANCSQVRVPVQVDAAARVHPGNILQTRARRVIGSP